MAQRLRVALCKPWLTLGTAVLARCPIAGLHQQPLALAAELALALGLSLSEALMNSKNDELTLKCNELTDNAIN